MPRTMRAIFRRWRAWSRRRAAIRELQALDNRTLKDMGLTRGEIIAAADGGVHGRTVDAADAATSRGYDERARQLRAELIAGLLRRGFARLMQLPRRAARNCAHATQESRHARCPHRAA